MNILVQGIILLPSPFKSEKSRDPKIGLYAEDGPPTDVADRLVSSFPHFMSIGISQRSMQAVLEYDK